MKKSEDLSHAFLLKHFPGRRKLSVTVPTEISWRNSVFLAVTALLITFITSCILYHQTMASLEQERALRVAVEQQLERMKTEIRGEEKSKRLAQEKVDAFSRELSALEEASVKEEKVFWSKMTSIMQKHALSHTNGTTDESSNLSEVSPELAQSPAPWEKAE